MLESLLFYSAWAALAAAIISSILIVQGAIRQLLTDSVDGPPGADDSAADLEPPPVERHV